MSIAGFKLNYPINPYNVGISFIFLIKTNVPVKKKILNWQPAYSISQNYGVAFQQTIDVGYSSVSNCALAKRTYALTVKCG